MPRLENWSVCKSVDNPFQAPECAKQHLQGDVYGNLEFHDGTFVVTSSIAKIEGNCVITKSGTRYTLGTVDPAYEQSYPNARERLLG